MKVLFYLGHPAHFHLFKNTIQHLRSKRVDPVICIKSKDVLESLLKENGFEYINISENYDRQKALKNFASRLWNLSKIIRRNKPKMLLGSAAELAVLGKLHRIPSYIFFEDDFEAVARFAKITGPLADHLVCPECCSAWKWNSKKIAHKSYHELAYLHPDHFTPDRSKVEKVFDLSKKNFLLRFAELSAYHDVGKTGINTSVASRLIEILKPHGNIHISSERELEREFEQYRISIPPSQIHHALFFADMYIGDSQTMTAEAAVLGTPAIRFNDFVGKLSYLEELEHEFGLTVGIKTHDAEKLFFTVDNLLRDQGLKKSWNEKRQRMLTSRIDLAEFMNKLVDENLKMV